MNNVTSDGTGPALNIFGQADYYQRHLFLSVLCHAISSKKASPLDPKYFQDKMGSSESEDDTEEDSDSGDENQADGLPEEDTKKTLLRRVTRRGRRRKSKSMDTEAAKTGSRHPSLRWADTMTFLNPVGYFVTWKLALLMQTGLSGGTQETDPTRQTQCSEEKGSSTRCRLECVLLSL